MSHAQLWNSWGSSWLPKCLNHVLVSLQLLHLLLSKVFLVSRVSLKGQWVIGILRVSLMVNIFISILPIGELCRIVAWLLCWGIVLGNWLEFTFWWQYFKWSKRGFVCCSCLHWMRVDNLSFFFEIESIFLGQNTCLPYLIWKLLLIVGDCTPWVRVAHKSIRAPGSFDTELARVSNYKFCIMHICLLPPEKPLA